MSQSTRWIATLSAITVEPRRDQWHPRHRIGRVDWAVEKERTAQTRHGASTHVKYWPGNFEDDSP